MFVVIDVDICIRFQKSGFPAFIIGNGKFAKVKDKGSIVIPGCTKLDEILYIEGLKANLLSISQMCEKDHKVNFH